MIDEILSDMGRKGYEPPCAGDKQWKGGSFGNCNACSGAKRVSGDNDGAHEMRNQHFGHCSTFGEEGITVGLLTGSSLKVKSVRFAKQKMAKFKL